MNLLEELTSIQCLPVRSAALLDEIRGEGMDFLRWTGGVEDWANAKMPTCEVGI